MLEVRYNTQTKELTGWCGDSRQFGNLKKRGGIEEIIILDIPVPEKNIRALCYDEATSTLIDNPNYIEPKPPRDSLAEIDKLKARIAELEKT